MQKYQLATTNIPPAKRAEVNEKILSLLASGNLMGITQEDIFNAYTGIGGLHGLDRKDFDNYHEYSEAKKEEEMGQFFTPHSVCKQIVELINPGPTDLIADITCGMGNFFNYFAEENCIGWDIDPKAIEIAKHLYPDAYLKCEDFRYFTTERKLDYVLGNPPFNIRMLKKERSTYGGFKDVTVMSQNLLFEKAAEYMKPGGLMLVVVPGSFLEDQFFSKGAILDIQLNFSWIGQYALEDNAFSAVGVGKFATKVMCWQRRADSLGFEEYTGDYDTWGQLHSKIALVLEKKREQAAKLQAEIAQQDHLKGQFGFKVKKLLFHIKQHPRSKKHLPHCLEYLEKFRLQKRPDDMKQEEWEKRQITENMVLRTLNHAIGKQDKVERDEIKLVKTDYGFRMKAYSEKSKRKMKVLYPAGTEWTINDMLMDGYPASFLKIPHSNYVKLLHKKEAAYKLQTTPFRELPYDSETGYFLRCFTFLNDKLKRCYFNKIQRQDLGTMLQKNYGCLAWQMGGGKTAGALAFSQYRPQRNTFVVSASLAINLTWVPFLQRNGIEAVQIETLADIQNLRPGQWGLLSFAYLMKYERHLKDYVIRQSQKVNLIFDESDEITNNQAKRTRAVLNVFRRVKRKLLTTGTTTRNNIGELYSQLELLYNNSINMISWPRYYYVETEVEDFETGRKEIVIKKQDNKYYRRPFPPYYGQTMFRRCFNPSKTTVFGINKQDQNIYNQEELNGIIEKTIITRKFREIAGDKYDIRNVKVLQHKDERALYKKIITDLHEILPHCFNSTGSSRKDSLLRAMRQLQLLIGATSTPQDFPTYTGDPIPNKARKIFELIEQNDEKIAIGCTSLVGANWYFRELGERFPDRKIFRIVGEVAFQKRKKIIAEFEATENGLLCCTQQSLKSSVNIPTCDLVLIESLQWNIPKIEQFYFRFIRYDSANRTKVLFINYENTIEVNLLALLMAKEKLNDYIKTLEYRENSDIYNEYDIPSDIFSTLLTKEEDEDGNLQISWGAGEVVKD